MSEWISVDEMLPSKKQPILMWNRIMKEVHIGFYDYYNNEWLYPADYNCKVKESISHWMLAPSPPGEGE